MRELREFALAEFASVRFYSGVDSHVLRQVRRVGETLGAGGTFVGLRVLLVDVMRVPEHI
jgi:hypothetical protein